MKDFTGSSITYYGLAREKVMKKYPRLISIIVILALICMTGLAIFLISDLVSFASNPDHKGVLVGLDIKGPENGIASMVDGKEKSRNLIDLDSDEKQNKGNDALSANSSLALENLSRQNKETNSANLSKNNATLPSSQSAKGIISISRSSGSRSSSKKYYSPSSSSSSSSSSSAKSAKKSNDENKIATNALAINETAKGQTPTNQPMNNSQGNESEIANATVSIDSSIPEDLHPIDAAKSLIESSINLSGEGQRSVLSDQQSANSQRSNDSEVQPKADLASLPSVAIGGITNPAKDALARESAAPSSPESELGQNSDSSNSGLESNSGTNTDNVVNADQVNADQVNADQVDADQVDADQVNTDGTTVSDTRASPNFGGQESSPAADDGNIAQSSKDSEKNRKSQAVGTRSASSQKSKVTASSQAQKAREARAELKASRNRVAENVKKNSAQSRARAARR